MTSSSEKVRLILAITRILPVPTALNLRRPFSSFRVSQTASVQRVQRRPQIIYHLPFYLLSHIYPLNSDKMDPQTQMDISNLSEADKKDLSQILQNESQKTTIQQSTFIQKHAEDRYPSFSFAYIRIECGTGGIKQKQKQPHPYLSFLSMLGTKRNKC